MDNSVSDSSTKSLNELILKELIHIRNDMKEEIRNLGSKLERYVEMLSVKSEEKIPGRLFPIKRSSCRRIAPNFRYQSIKTDNSGKNVFQNILEAISSTADTYDDNFGADVFRDSDGDHSHNENNSVEALDVDSRESVSGLFPQECTSKDLETPVVNDATQKEQEVALADTKYCNIPGFNKLPEANHLQKFNNLKQITSNLKTHRRKQNLRQYKCEICHKFFSTKDYLKKHEVIHSDSRKFECEVCSKRFRRKFELRRHHIIHTGERPFHCQLCGKAFKRSDEVSSHMRVHTNKEQYRCLFCSMIFQSLSKREEHIMNIHYPKDEKGDGWKPVTDE